LNSRRWRLNLPKHFKEINQFQMGYLIHIWETLKWTMYVRLVIKEQHYALGILDISRQHHLYFKCNILITYKNYYKAYVMFVVIQRLICRVKRFFHCQKQQHKNKTILARLLKKVSRWKYVQHATSLNHIKLN
jgi:hypothetical protein